MNAHTISDPYHALTSYERAEAEKGFAVAEGLLAAYDVSVDVLRRYVATPLVSLYLRGRLIDELSRLSERSLTDIGMSRREIVAAARKAYPLFDGAEAQAGVPVTDVRQVATVAQTAKPANDDANRRAA